MSKAASSHKVVVIGLDGATFDLIDPLINEGKLPTLAEMMQSGSRAHLRSTIPHHSGPAWTSFATGMSPGEHGIYSFFQRDFGSYTYPPVNSRLVQAETLWQRISRAGKTVGVMNVPGTFPPVPVNGFMITGMLSPGLDLAFYPPHLRERVLERAPDYSVEAIPLSDKAEYLEMVHRSIGARKNTALYLLDQHPTDLFVVVFTELDRLQHFFWADMDLHHPVHLPSTSPDFAQAIENGYIALDQAVKEIVEAVDEDAIVFVMSDHGFEGVYKVFYVNRWLAEHGYLKLKPRQSGSAVQYARETLKKLKLWKLARRIGRLVPHARQFRADNLSYAMDIDWGRTKVAFGPNLGININLQGREPNGIVSPGQEYERLCETLQRDLESYIDPETGERIVEKVVRREEVYTGNAVELAPDLRLIMAKSSVYRGQYAYSPKVNASQSLGRPDKVYGNHAEYGILLACGTSIRAGLQLNGTQIIDVAPTIMYAMGLPIPKNMDGRALKEIFDSSFMPPQDQGGNSSISRASSANGTRVFSEADEQEVLSRLRNLGYLD